MGKKYIDLHCHSDYSDGNYNIEELIDICNKTNTGYLSITDHYDLRSTKKIKEIDCQGIIFIPGIELSTVFRHKDGREYFIHILGYGIDNENKYLCEEVERYRQNRIKNNLDLIRNIKSSGLIIPNCLLDKDLISNYNNIVSEFKKRLIHENYDKSFIKKFISVAQFFCPDYDNYEMDVFKAIGLIRHAGGVPVLAHPQKIEFSTAKDYYDFLCTAKSYGLMGVEVYYSEFSSRIIEYNSNLCKTLGLMESVGSDFHVIDEDKKLPGLGINHNLCKTDCSLMEYLTNYNKTIKPNQKNEFEL